MTPQQVLAEFGDQSALDDVARHWETSMSTMPSEPPFFLTDDCWRTYSRWSGFGDELDERLARVAAGVRRNRALTCLSWHAYWRVYLSPERCAPSGWPLPTNHFGDDAPMFYMLVAFAMVPLMREKHAQWGIPEDITRDTAQQIKRYCDDTYRRGHDGTPGIYLSQLGWLRHYTREKYVRLGRLEYWLGPNPYQLKAYRHKTSGQVVALAPDRTRFADDGSIYRDPDEYAENEGWTATLEETEEETTGFLIDPNGNGTPNRVTLPHDEWECVLEHGDNSLMMHIPSGGRMTPDACEESLQRAASFFPNTFPDERPRAVVCSSWIFSPLLQEIFPAEANLCVFQRNLYLFPVPSGPWDGLWFVFLQRGELDLETAPRETSLQRKLLAYLEAGNRWRVAGMFILMDDICKFGNEPYRAEWPPTNLV